MEGVLDRFRKNAGGYVLLFVNSLWVKWGVK